MNDDDPVLDDPLWLRNEVRRQRVAMKALYEENERLGSSRFDAEVREEQTRLKLAAANALLGDAATEMENDPSHEFESAPRIRAHLAGQPAAPTAERAALDAIRAAIIQKAHIESNPLGAVMAIVEIVDGLAGQRPVVTECAHGRLRPGRLCPRCQVVGKR